jgi:predicted GNAT family acetyltransferase
VHVKRVASAEEFLRLAGPLLLEDEARHNLVLGLAGTLRDHPAVYEAFDLLVVEDGGLPVAAALRTPPYNLVVSRPADPAALDPLVAALASEHGELPGVSGAVPEVDAFAAEWERRTGDTASARMRQRIYAITKVRVPEGVLGGAREATEADRDLLLAWIREFAAEVHADADAPVSNVERTVDARLRHGAGSFALWEVDGVPVSLAGWGGRTPTGVRVGPVYTPPDWRGRGYGSAVTAAVTAERLASGRRFCFLYTDLANPTSNKIYVDIGYEPVCDSVEYAFRTS